MDPSVPTTTGITSTLLIFHNVLISLLWSCYFSSFFVFVFSYLLLLVSEKVALLRSFFNTPRLLNLRQFSNTPRLFQPPPPLIRFWGFFQPPDYSSPPSIRHQRLVCSITMGLSILSRFFQFLKSIFIIQRTIYPLSASIFY